LNGKRYETTVGRILLFEILPEEMPFDIINKVMDKKSIADMIEDCYRRSAARRRSSWPIT
jgi:DNA-directed RNA polymerase subunit beta'